MPKDNLPKICSSVMCFFKKAATQIDKMETEKAVKFVKRKSKLNAQLFAEILILGCLWDPRISLDRLCGLLKEKGIKISKQGLHQRFNAGALKLMSNLLAKSLEEFKTEKNEVLDLLRRFSSIKIQDSSSISLPENLELSYKGCGGSGSKAGLKLQVLFDYVRGQIDKVSTAQGCESDQGFDGHLGHLEKGALYLQDLGYFKLKSFQKIREKEAYFISRYLYPTTLLTQSGKPLALLKALKKSASSFAQTVYLGQKEKIEIRLMATRLSDEEADKRVRRIKKKAQNRGRSPTQETLELARWSIYITNVPENVLSDEQVYLVYSLRWQIELFFKLSKSEAGIDKVSGKKTARVLCEIYAKLIAIATLLYLCFPIRWQTSQEVSFSKAYKLLRLRASHFFKALQSSYRLMKFIEAFLSDLKDFSLKEKYRKKRRLTYQKIMDTTGQEVLA